MTVTKKDPYFYINGHDFRISVDSTSESELNLVKTKMYVPDSAWGYNDIQFTNFSGDIQTLTAFSRITETYIGEEAQPEESGQGIADFYNTPRTPHAVLKYWAENFVPCNVKTNLQSFENGKYVIETFKQRNPTFDFVVTDFTLAQYETPSELKQTYYSPVEYDENTILLSAEVEEIEMIKEGRGDVNSIELYSQTCDCNEFTPALQCTATVEENVRIIQQYLQDWGYFPSYTHTTGSIEPTGKYCYTTTQAIMSFQMDEGIPVNGDFTEETRLKFLRRIVEG